MKLTAEEFAACVAAVLVETGPLMNRVETAFMTTTSDPMTLRQFRVLRRIEQGYDTATAIQRLGPATLASLSEVLDGLVSRGLVQRERDGVDRRVVRLQLTAKGSRAMTHAHAALADLEERIKGVVLEVVADPPEEMNQRLRTDLLAWIGK